MAIDWSPSSLSDKRSILDQLQARWVQNQYEDKYFTWYASADKEKERCESAWYWYKDNHSNCTSNIEKFVRSDDVLTFLDHCPFTLDEKRFHLEQIKKKFKAQQTGANRKGKRQTNLTLSDDTSKVLDHLAEKYRMTKTELVECLIQNAHERGMLD